jgi:hypothetical protein
MAGDTKATIRLTRTRLLLGTLALVLLCGGASFAAAQVSFRDTSHGNALTIAGAGCLNGFSDGTFRPQQKVTRLGLAGALRACSGRAGFGEATEQLAQNTEVVLRGLQLPGAQTDVSAGFYLVTATIEVSTSGERALPCTARFSLTQTGGQEGNEQVLLDIPANPEGTAQHVNATMVERVRTAQGLSLDNTVEVQLYGNLEGGCATPVIADVAYTALYTPLDAVGTSGGDSLP